MLQILLPAEIELFFLVNLRRYFAHKCGDAIAKISKRCLLFFQLATRRLKCTRRLDQVRSLQKGDAPQFASFVRLADGNVLSVAQKITQTVGFHPKLVDEVGFSTEFGQLARMLVLEF